MSRQIVRTFVLLFTFISLSDLEGCSVKAFESDELPLDEDNFPSEQVGRSDGGAGERNYGGGKREGPTISGAGIVDSQVKFNLEHSLGRNTGEDFGIGGVFVARIRTSLQGLQRLSRLQLERTKLSHSERTALEELAASDGYYRVRVPASVFGSDKYVMASAPAKCLLAAKLADHFDLHVDGAGNVISLAYSPAADCFTASRSDQALSSGWEFNSSASLSFGQTALKLVPASEELLNAQQGTQDISKPGEEPQKPPEPKTFWQKYWMYVIPGVLIVFNQLLAGVAGDAPQGAPAGGGGASRPSGSAARRR